MVGPLLDRHVAEGRGDTPALRMAQGELSYAELQMLVNRVGNALRDAGVEPEQRVAILVADAPFLELLAADNHLIAPIHPGFDRSERPAEFDSVDDLAYLYLDLLDDMGIVGRDEAAQHLAAAGGANSLDAEHVFQRHRQAGQRADRLTLAAARINGPGLGEGVFLVKQEERSEAEGQSVCIYG